MSKVLDDPLGALLMLLMAGWLVHSHHVVAATLAIVPAAGAAFVWYVLTAERVRRPN